MAVYLFQISSDPIHMISSDPSLEKPPEYSTVVDVPPCYEDAIKLSATPIVFRLKQALTSSGHPINQNQNVNVETNGVASKNYAEQNHSSALASTIDGEDFCTRAASTGQTEKCAPEEVSSPSQNSSQNENAIAKVFRKSIRGIRRFRSGSEDSNNSLGQASNLENGSLHETNSVEPTKVDR